MGITEAGLQSRHKSYVSSVDACETQIQGQNMWMHTGLHLYIQGGEYSKAEVILAWKYHKKPLLVWGFSFTIFLFQFRFNTPVYDRYFYIQIFLVLNLHKNLITVK